MKTSQRLKQIKAKERFIESQLKQIDKLESRALKVTASMPQADRVSGGVKQSKDDVYAELISAQDELSKQTAALIREQSEFRQAICAIPDDISRQILQAVYIDYKTAWEICDELEISKATYYVWLRRAEKFLDD